jgi:mersacidin/lichenicidin family type 2 lantibiotic
MPTMEIVRAWKDEEYRDTLTADQRSILPDHPSGVIEFGQPQLEDESLFGPGEMRCKYSKYTHKCTENNGHCRM